MLITPHSIDEQSADRVPAHPPRSRPASSPVKYLDSSAGIESAAQMPLLFVPVHRRVNNQTGWKREPHALPLGSFMPTALGRVLPGRAFSNEVAWPAACLTDRPCGFGWTTTTCRRANRRLSLARRRRSLRSRTNRLIGPTRPRSRDARHPVAESAAVPLHVDRYAYSVATT